MPSISSSSRTAVAAGLAVVTVLAATTISPAALMVPIALIAVLLLASRRPPRQTPTLGGSATFSAQLRAVSFPSSSIGLLHAAIGASIGLAYVLVVLCL